MEQNHTYTHLLLHIPHSSTTFPADTRHSFEDCHSFSAQPNLLNAEPSEIDICIGYNDDDSCPPRTTIDTIAHHFASSGYKIGINVPFSNAKTFAVPAPYHSVMIEVNKRLYMNEQTLQKSAEFERLQQDIQSLYDGLAKRES